jgi:hypothetical protein
LLEKRQLFQTIAMAQDYDTNTHLGWRSAAAADVCGDDRLLIQPQILRFLEPTPSKQVQKPSGDIELLDAGMEAPDHLWGGSDLLLAEDEAPWSSLQALVEFGDSPVTFGNDPSPDANDSIQFS